MNDLEVKLAVKIAEVEQDGLAFTAFEGAARVVDLIIHFLADAQHAFARAVADVFPAVEHVGDRRRGNARRLCDILDDHIHSYAPLTGQIVAQVLKHLTGHRRGHAAATAAVFTSTLMA